MHAHLVLQLRHLVALFQQLNDDSIPKPKPTAGHVLSPKGAEQPVLTAREVSEMLFRISVCLSVCSSLALCVCLLLLPLSVCSRLNTHLSYRPPPQIALSLPSLSKPSNTVPASVYTVMRLQSWFSIQSARENRRDYAIRHKQSLCFKSLLCVTQNTQTQFQWQPVAPV